MKKADVGEKGPSRAQYPLHWAAYYNRVDDLTAALASADKAKLKELDTQGNTALHVAALRHSYACLDALLAAGCAAYTNNERGWPAMAVAVEVKDRATAMKLAKMEVLQMKEQVKLKRAGLLASLRALPDFTLQLKWEIVSSLPGVSMLVRKYAPHDTYTIWKVGPRIRVDGTLMGIENDHAGFLPEWKRGNFSLLYDGSGPKASVLFVNRGKSKYYDVKAMKKQMAPMDDAQTEAEVDAWLAGDKIEVTKIRTADFRFKPVTGWFTSTITEKVEGWNTTVYEAAGKLMAVKKRKTPMVLPANASFEQYLAHKHEPDESMEVAFNPLSASALMDGGGAPKPSAMPAAKEEAAKANKKVKHVTGKCWMAADFPLSMKQLLPLLEVVGTANKHIKKTARFMSKYGDLNMFPVKVDVPVMMTIHVVLSFKHFKLLSPREPLARDFFSVPPGFVLREVADLDLLGVKKKNKSSSSSTIPGETKRNLMNGDDPEYQFA